MKHISPDMVPNMRGMTSVFPQSDVPVNLTSLVFSQSVICVGLYTLLL